MKQRKVTTMLMAAVMAGTLLLGTGAAAEGKDSVVISVGGDPTTLAPNGQSGDGWTYAQIYDQLWNLSGSELTMRLATGYEAEDETHYVITIQPGIKDTAGNEIKAADVLFSIGLAKNGTAGYPGATRYVDVENCEVIDDTTLRVALTQPCSFQMNALSMVNIVTQASYEASEDGMVTTPVGSGPYMLEEYVTGSHITMTANPDYWDGQPEAINKVTVNFVQEASQRANVALTGESDFSYCVSYMDSQALEDAENLVFSHDTSLNSTVMIFNNYETSPFSGNLDLRKAVAYATNNEAIIATAVGGFGEVSVSCTSPNFSDYNESYAEISAETGNYAYNMEKAKEHLAASGVAEGTTLRLLIGNQVGFDVAGQVIQAGLAELGLNMELLYYPDTQNVVASNQPEDWDFALWSWTNYPAQSGLATLNTFIVASDYTHLPEAEQEVIATDVANAMAAPEDGVAAAMDVLMTDMYEQIPVYGLFDECRLNAYNADLNVVFKCQDYPLINKWTWK